MARVRFTENFDYKPTRRITIAYEAGWSGTVKRDCARKAIAARKAVDLEAGSASNDEASQPGEA